MNLFRLVKPTLFAGASAMTLLMSLDSAKAQAPSNSTEWNYFGTCYSDDVIYASDGHYHTPAFGGRGYKGPKWEYGGTYRRINDDSIAITNKNSRPPSIYWHERVANKVCQR